MLDLPPLLHCRWSASAFQQPGSMTPRLAQPARAAAPDQGATCMRVRETCATCSPAKPVAPVMSVIRPAGSGGAACHAKCNGSGLPFDARIVRAREQRLDDIDPAPGADP
jgi:hypothetical protein